MLSVIVFIIDFLIYEWLGIELFFGIRKSKLAFLSTLGLLVIFVCVAKLSSLSEVKQSTLHNYIPLKVEINDSPQNRIEVKQQLNNAIPSTITQQLVNTPVKQDRNYVNQQNKNNSTQKQDEQSFFK